MSYAVFDSELLQVIEAQKESVRQGYLAWLTIRSSRSKAEQKRCWHQRVTL